MIRKSNKTVKTTMDTDCDRFVTPTMTFDKTSPSETVSAWIPTLDDDAVVTLELAPREHRFNYPCMEGCARPEGPHGYADNDIILEWDMDDPDGTTITDRVQGIVLTEAGDPTYQVSAATAGLGNGVTYDGTADLHALTLADATATESLTLPETGDFSVEVVFLADNANTGAADTIVCCRNGAAGIGWALLFDANQHLDFHIDDTTETVLEGSVDCATDAIVHAIVTVDRDGNGYIYIKGALDETKAVTASPGTLLDPSATTKLSIGCDAAGTGLLYGNVYFARVYDRVLTAAEALENYRVMMNKGYPGWTPKGDPVDGNDLVVCASASDPLEFDLTEYMTMKSMAFRAICAIEQTTNPTDLDFYWLFE